ncbi:histone acetyltransferase [Candidatus Thiodiazotropha endoloripes]|uniref:aminoglycoside 6'-N-acetyltransferase n=1 Tax=Candidatus Thiodiazotropha endoloripes TaxID=1818881 RepID=UPI00083DA2A3|nr:aminoglycoside 6'-N-acetyltransferase [Candidatus Thiodiazotropha endoloripes]MCW4183821.1 GNAT family N-acetyltransferase [Candidatus Thiodiazotropha weberae]MCW4190434.1 GNAT family N-acetyltransferase [Candidatus Thiodiazotropha weberae]ODB94099.1 histone acetyltransferase [Candidatus Thiodiazotropha endoloripes]
MNIRPVESTDLTDWVNMRSELWPKHQTHHPAELADYFSGRSIDIVETFVVEIAANKLVGFIELNIRNFAEGSRSSRVPYIEAWFVKPEHRGKGYGQALIRQAESWAMKEGFEEIASDTELHNHKSIALHKQLGFIETERIVCFLKSLKQT